jgi:hypothetical protein
MLLDALLTVGTEEGDDLQLDELLHATFTKFEDQLTSTAAID